MWMCMRMVGLSDGFSNPIGAQLRWNAVQMLALFHQASTFWLYCIALICGHHQTCGQSYLQCASSAIVVASIQLTSTCVRLRRPRSSLTIQGCHRQVIIKPEFLMLLMFHVDLRIVCACRVNRCAGSTFQPFIKQSSQLCWTCWRALVCHAHMRNTLDSFYSISSSLFASLRPPSCLFLPRTMNPAVALSLPTWTLRICVLPPIIAAGCWCFTQVTRRQACNWHEASLLGMVKVTTRKFRVVHDKRNLALFTYALSAFWWWLMKIVSC